MRTVRSAVVTVVVGVALVGCGDEEFSESQAVADATLEIVGAEDLALALARERAPRVIDVRSRDAFVAGHVPAAVWIDPAGLRAEVAGIAGQVAASGVARMAFELAGLTPGLDVIVYGEANDTEPARVVWTLAYYGHIGSVSMVDGGYAAWTARGGEISADPSAPDRSEYPTAVREGLRVDAPWVLAHLDAPEVTLVDARSTMEFEAGHIPGAVQVDWVTNIGEDGLFLDRSALRSLYGNPAPDQTLVVYCRTGSRASIDWLVLRALGYADVRIYDGSWEEWGSSARYPVEP